MTILRRRFQDLFVTMKLDPDVADFFRNEVRSPLDPVRVRTALLLLRRLGFVTVHLEPGYRHNIEFWAPTPVFSELTSRLQITTLTGRHRQGDLTRLPVSDRD